MKAAVMNVGEKMNLVRQHCAPLIGRTITQFETAEIYLDDSWDQWVDLPIRIHCGEAGMVAVSWSHFDTLWLANDTSLPFCTDGSKVRWVASGQPKLNPALGKAIHGVMLGRGEMSIESQDVEIWTRLVLDLGDLWVEVFNALDENGYELHVEKPTGEFRHCC